jgi:ABC-type transport system involved in multi-copper enzyme maturation permease subunit
MTATALASIPTGTVRPVPWRQLAWVAWRRYRTTLVAVVGLIAVMAVFLLARGHQMRDAYATVQACAPQATAKCGFAYSVFRDTYASTGPLAAVFVWMPAIIGAFAGAPLLARELESGTFRYAWTQGAGRTRWMVSLTAAGVLGVAAVAAAFGLLISWYQEPLFTSGIEQRMHASVFPVIGIAVVGWALAAFALGVFFGLLTRRVLPALAIALAVWTGMAFLVAGVLRPNYAAPLVTSKLELPVTAFPVEQWWTKGGVRVTDAQINQVLQAVGIQGYGVGNVQVSPGSNSVDPVQYLLQHGYTQLTSYQPNGRYWGFQWIEFGWLTILSALLLGASIWLLRRRPA